MYYTKIIISLLFIILPVIAFAQTWSNVDGQKLYYKCYEFAAKDPKLTDKQVDNICLCFKEKITKLYTKDIYKKMENSKIEGIQNNVILKCAKNLGTKFVWSPKIKKIDL